MTEKFAPDQDDEKNTWNVENPDIPGDSMWPFHPLVT